MNTLVTILITILVFGVIIFIHELGHFIAAKASGIKVHEFALGMGPTLFHFTKGETKYALRLFPIGGFVSMEGEDAESDDERAFSKKPVWKRIIVVVAGALMNVLLGFVILLFLNGFRAGGVPTTVIAQFNGDSAAIEQSGLQIGDKILKINGRSMLIEQDIPFATSQDADGVVEMVVRRDGKKITLPEVPVSPVTIVNEAGEEETVYPFFVASEKKNVLSLLKYTALNTLYVVRIVWLSLVQLVTGQASVNDLSGPIGVGKVIGQATAMSASALFNMIAFITINIGVFNLLPIPALDGGRLIFLIIEGIRRKPINPKYEGYVHAVGLILLLVLMVFVTFKDIIGLFGT